MANTGPPYYATDPLEAERAHQHMLDRRRRSAFRARLEASLRGSPAALRTLKDNWAPITRK